MYIKQAREAAGLKQHEVAQRVGVSQSSVCAWEKGEAYPSAENLIKLADVLGTTTDALLGREKCTDIA